MERTLRQELFRLLSSEEHDLRTLSQQLRISEKEVMTHLPHIDLSAKNQGQRLIIQPSTCLSCGFIFKDRRRPTKPSRCPRCKKSRLTLPTYRIK